MVFVLPAGKLLQNNDGDAVALLDECWKVVHLISYTGREVVTGVPIEFR